ncbi:LPS export ABC transporter ATP-binding protein [Marinobacterium sp. LSUCC0821]|uniref:LPS export ABC transporter ATP-binding protein n=1 Tax=Marinobacterium sp. LSUCC0821 TaxID=2668067 RepID=UPI0014525D5E|nr:LPS export ABC transporter ATP-binding protein [Marinobacterium sp. LSUCC0821]QJD70397.1 LPS export ABC transporter ATP-binding protein [Marinobacterium sp. LSUCC0821]
MSSLEALNLAKSYKGRAVIRDVSVRVERGEIVGLLGPNGAGKTTCFYMIVGLIRADQGNIRLNQDDVTRMPIHQRAARGLGYLPQEASVFRKLSVYDNLMAILENRKDLTKTERDEKAEALLQEFHITHIRDSKGMVLSGGERRRVEIARALANDPEFILLDEPFAGVDPISVSDIKQTIRHLKERGIGVLITDHNVRETLDICERAYIVSEGTILAEGAPSVIMENRAVRDAYLGEDFRL